MSAALLDRVPVDSITAQAREVRPGRAVLTLVGGVLFAVGWCVARLFAVAWLVVAWSWTAVAVGWRQALAKPDVPDVPRADLVAENDRLRAEIRRLS